MRACEIRYKLTALLRVVAFCGLLLFGAASVLTAAQPDHEAAAADAAHAEEESHEGGLIDMVARLLNFGILVGGLVYVLGGPIKKYLGDRHDKLRSDLVTAAQMRKTANEQLATIEQQIAALPGELDTLRAHGTEEIAAEEARIAKVSETERERLLEQLRRELDRQVRVARRELVAEAAELATRVAATRIGDTITDEDQERLMDRYLSQLDASDSGSDAKVTG